MCTTRIAALADQLWRDTPTGILLKAAIEDLQLEMGTTTPFGEEPPSKPRCWMTTPSWIKAWVKFMWDHHIVIDNLGCKIENHRCNDTDIMTSFTNLTSDTSILRSLKRYRMAKEVTWLSDVYNAGGSTIHPSAFTTYPTGQSKFLWPHKHKQQQLTG